MPEIDLPFEHRLIGHFLRKHADTIGDRRYLTVCDQSFSFHETDRRARAVARDLADRGIGDGDRVMLMLPNCPEFVFTWFAANLRGAAAVPINYQLRGPLLEALLADARPAMLITHASLLEPVGELPADLVPPHVVVVGGLGGQELRIGRSRAVDFAALYHADGPDPEIPGDYRRVQTISYTSGTTGPSKGVMVPNSAAFCAPVNYIKVMGMTAEDSIFSPLPLFHGMSSRHGAMPCLVLGTGITIDERFSASRYWERAAECKATLGMIVHALVPLLIAQPPRESDRGHGVRAIFNAKHDEGFEERFGAVTVEAYAVTECSHVLHTPYPERRWGSTGRANPDWDVQLVGPDDLPVPLGEPGELICRPRKPHIMMKGYLNKPDTTLEAFRHLWYHTGDFLRQDADGYFYYLDRSKDRIRRRGVNISSQDVENTVVGYSGVAECAAMPYSAGDGEDEIRIIVIPHPGAAIAPAALHAWLTERMPKYMVPRFIELRASLPRTGTSKIEKHKLIQEGLGPDTWDAAKG